MGNVTFKFNRNLFQKLTLGLMLHVTLDNQETIKVSPDTSVDMEFEVGAHTVYASFPFQGNEFGATSIEINVVPKVNYELVYTFGSLGVGKITLKEK